MTRILSSDSVLKASLKVDRSVVIPAYNEELRLPSTLESVCNYLATRDGANEVIVVSDGSTDGTDRVVESAKAKYPFLKLLSYKKNHGKGFALRYGVLNSAGAVVLINDADGSTPIQELARLESEIKNGADVVIGSRALHSAETKVKTVWYRKIIGRTFATLVNILIVSGIADTQCGFKLFTREAADKLFSRQRSEKFSFDVELLFLARKMKMVIAEVPVNWTNTPGSKVNLVRDSLEMFLDIIRFRLMALSGVYEKSLSREEVSPEG